MEWPTPLCSEAGATTTTSPSFLSCVRRARRPGAYTPSSLVSSIRTFANISCLVLCPNRFQAFSVARYGDNVVQSDGLRRGHTEGGEARPRAGLVAMIHDRPAGRFPLPAWPGKSARAARDGAFEKPLEPR